MTRAEIDEVFADIERPSSRAEPSALQVEVLARVVAAQEQRLRALEPCPFQAFQPSPHNGARVGAASSAT